ncbi:MAG: replication initiation protein [Flavobacteriaceae bacterium]
MADIDHNNNYTSLDYFRDNLPENLRCGHEKTNTFIYNKKSASKLKYIQSNHDCNFKFLCFDIDSQHFDPFILQNELDLPLPNLKVTNPESGHCHIIYSIKVPVHNNQNSSYRALKYYKAIFNAMKTLLEPYGSDKGFVNYLIQNPLSKHWYVEEYSKIEYELKDFSKSKYIDLSLYYSAKNIERNIENPFEPVVGERNCYIFKELSLFSYEQVDNYRPHRFEDWDALIFSQAEKINEYVGFKSKSIEYNELKHIAKSVRDYTWSKWTNPVRRGRDKLSASLLSDLKDKQALAAIKTNEIRRNKTKDRIVYGLKFCEENNLKKTQKKVAEVAGLSARVIRNYKDFFHHIKKSGTTVYIR